MLAFLFILFLPIAALATDWDACIQYLYTNSTPNKDYLITAHEGGVLIEWKRPEPKPTTNELLAVETVAVSNKLDKIQKGKSVYQRKYENTFFALVKSVLQLAEDPRGGLPVAQIPKLSFEEINTILDTLLDNTGKEKQANKLSLKLLSVNAALQRYELKWWDNAAYHTEVP